MMPVGATGPVQLDVRAITVIIRDLKQLKGPALGETDIIAFFKENHTGQYDERLLGILAKAITSPPMYGTVDV